MMTFQGPLICHALGTPEALLATCNIMIINVWSCLVLSCCTNAIFQSIVFYVSLQVYAEFVYVQIYLILNINICSLLVRIDCVAMKPERKLYFLERKTGSTVLNLVPGTLEISFQGFEIPKFSGGARPQTPQEEGV